MSIAAAVALACAVFGVAGTGCSVSRARVTSAPAAAPPSSAAAPASLLPAGFATYSVEVGDAGVEARAEPDPGAPVVKAYAARNPLGFDRESFGVVEARPGADGAPWFRVQLSQIRPNNTTAWVPASAVGVHGHNQRIDVDLAGRTATLSDSGREVLRFPVGIGKDDTPTPVGDFYVWTKWTPEQGSPATYGPGVLGLSAMSETIDRWHGSDPLIGMHGAIRTSDLGNAVSNGCIRMAPDVTTRLLTDVELGTPVHIH